MSLIATLRSVGVDGADASYVGALRQVHGRDSEGNTESWGDVEEDLWTPTGLTGQTIGAEFGEHPITSSLEIAHRAVSVKFRFEPSPFRIDQLDREGFSQGAAAAITGARGPMTWGVLPVAYTRELECWTDGAEDETPPEDGAYTQVEMEGGGWWHGHLRDWEVEGSASLALALMAYELRSGTTDERELRLVGPAGLGAAIASEMIADAGELARNYAALQASYAAFDLAVTPAGFSAGEFSDADAVEDTLRKILAQMVDGTLSFTGYVLGSANPLFVGTLTARKIEYGGVSLPWIGVDFDAGEVTIEGGLQPGEVVPTDS